MAKKKAKGSNNDPDKEFIDVTSLGKGVIFLGQKRKPLNSLAAKRFLKYEQFGGERRPDPGHIDDLVKAMKRGTFEGSITQLAIVLYKGKEYRVNGQHTCHARLHFEGDPDYDYEVQLLRYEAKTYEDLRNIYSVFDRGKTRDAKHVLHAQLAGYEGWADITQKPAASTAAGFPFFLMEDKRDRNALDVDEISSLLKNDYLDLGVMVAHFVQDHYGKEHGHLRYKSVTAAIFATMEVAGEDALPFWESVADGLNITNRRQPPAKLRTILQQHRADCAMQKKNKAKEEFLFRRCIHLWNVWRKTPDKHVMKLPVVYEGLRDKVL